MTSLHLALRRFALVALCAAAPRTSIADVKDSILRDCADAQREFGAFPVEKRMELVPFFREVLKLKITTPPEPIAPLPPRTALPGLSVETDLQRIWASFNPDRELAAKHCALQLLRALGPEAAQALPEIVTLAADPTLSDELHESLDESAFTIARSIEPGVPDALIHEVAQQALTERGLLAQTVLAYYPVQPTLKILLGIIDSEETASRAVPILLWLEPSGRISQSILLSALAPDTPEWTKIAALRTFGELGCLKFDSAVSVVGSLASPSPAVAENARNVLLKLGEKLSEESYCRAGQEGISGSDLLQIILQSIPEKAVDSDAAFRAVIAQRLHLATPLLRRRNPARIYELLTELLEHGTDDERRIAEASLLALGKSSLDFILKYLRNDSASSRSRAAAALASIPNLDAPHVRPFVPFLLDKEPGVRQSILEAVLPLAKELRPELRRLPAAPPESGGVERQRAYSASGLSDESLPAPAEPSPAAPATPAATPDEAQLLEQLEKSAMAEQPGILRSLAQLPALSPESLSRIRTFQQSKNMDLRYEAIIALIRHSENRDEWLPAATSLLDSRLSIRFAFERLPAPVVEALRALPAKHHPVRRNSLAVLIGRIQ